jgi:hypothetical protein
VTSFDPWNKSESDLERLETRTRKTLLRRYMLFYDRRLRHLARVRIGSLFNLNLRTLEVDELPPPEIKMPELPHDPVHQIRTALWIKNLESRADELSGLEIMNAVSRCLTDGLIAPKWLAALFSKRLQPIRELEVSSWDDPKALGRPVRKGQSQAIVKAHKNLKRRVVETVRTKLFERNQRSGKFVPVDTIFWESVAKAKGVHSNRLLVQKLYREYVARGGHDYISLRKAKKLPFFDASGQPLNASSRSVLAKVLGIRP